jgi:hypothetical protein
MVAAGGHRRLVDSRRQQLEQLMTSRLGRWRARTETGERALNHLGPSRVLERGYSITTIEGSTVPLRDPSSVRSGQLLMSRLALGELRSVARATTKKPVAADESSADSQPSLFDKDPEHQGRAIRGPAFEAGGDRRPARGRVGRFGGGARAL